MPAEFKTMAEMRAFVGREVYVSDWLEITQDRVNKFAEATGDFQWIHVDVERAKHESPYGGTIAHGYLTLSLIAKFAMENVLVRDRKSGVNYGLNKARFMGPVKVRSRIRGRGKLAGLDDIEGGYQTTWITTVEVEGVDKPVCVVESVGRMYR